MFILDHAGGGGAVGPTGPTGPAGPAGPTGPTGPRTIAFAFAAQNMVAAPSNSYLFPGNGATSNILITVIGSFVAPFTGNLNSFFVNHRNPGGASDISYELDIEGVNQAAATIVLNSGATGPASVLAVNVAITQGQRFNVRAVLPAGAPTNARPIWQCLLTG